MPDHHQRPDYRRFTIPFRCRRDPGLPVFRNYVKLPADYLQYVNVKSYVEDTPNPDYSQASDAARAAFREMKFGVRIHWGVYCKLGYGCNASWPFVRADGGHPGLNNEQRQQYQNFYKTFNPTQLQCRRLDGVVPDQRHQGRGLHHQTP